MGWWSGSGGLSPFSGGGYFGGKSNLMTMGGTGALGMLSGLNQGRLPFGMPGMQSQSPYQQGVSNWMNYIGGGKSGREYMPDFGGDGNMNLGGFITPSSYLDSGYGNWGRNG